MRAKIIDTKPRIIELDFLGKHYKQTQLQPHTKPFQKALYIHMRGFSGLEVSEEILMFIKGFEVKPEKFKGKDRLFEWKGMRLKHTLNMMRLQEFMLRNDLQGQFHFPYDKIEGKYLTAGDPDHHTALLDCFGAYAEVIKKFSFGPNITLHPVSVKDVDDRAAVNKAIVAANAFYRRLGEEIVRNNWPICVGLENQPDPGINHYPKDSLGYKETHFTRLMEGTNDHYQIVIDSGHRNLAANFSVEKMAENWCVKHNKHIQTFHLHENRGLAHKSSTEGKSRDLHKLAMSGHVPGFTNYLLRSLIDHIPLVLEIDTAHYGAHPMRVFHYIAGLDTTLNVLSEIISKLLLPFSTEKIDIKK